MELIAVIMLLTGYFLPAILAKVRGKKDFMAILALNALTGWTCIGWIAALVWSLMND